MKMQPAGPPFVSIVVPVYNGERFVAETIESIREALKARLPEADEPEEEEPPKKMPIVKVDLTSVKINAAALKLKLPGVSLLPEEELVVTDGNGHFYSAIVESVLANDTMYLRIDWASKRNEPGAIIDPTVDMASGVGELPGQMDSERSGAPGS